MQTIMYRLDKQYPTVQYGKLYSISYDKPQWKRILKKSEYMFITESLCSTAEMNTTLSINYTSIEINLRNSCSGHLSCS